MLARQLGVVDLGYGTNDFERVGARRLCEFQKLDHIKAALARFDFGNEGLVTAELPGDVNLAQTSILSRRDEQSA